MSESTLRLALAVLSGRSNLALTNAEYASLGMHPSVYGNTAAIRAAAEDIVFRAIMRPMDILDRPVKIVPAEGA